LVVTSTFENEGKTMLVMGLASSATAAGMRTVIIDANFTHGAIAQAFGVKAHAYLDEYDGSDKSFDRLLHKDVQSGAHFIVGRAGAPISEIFLAGPRFAALMDSLKARFDLVLIDTPGLATAPDALDAASQADRLLFVVDFQTRHPQQVIASIRSLSACGHRPDGIILNRVSRRSHSELMEELLAPSWASADPIPTADRKIRQIV
jgi:Mrp family chromosome partitioning ATPase